MPLWIGKQPHLTSAAPGESVEGPSEAAPLAEEAAPTTEPQVAPVEQAAEPVVEVEAEPAVEVEAEPAVEVEAEPVVEAEAEPVVEAEAEPVEPVEPVEAEPAEPFTPDPSFSAMSPSAEAYAAARAAQAARLIGARYGTEADDYLNHVRLAVHALNDDVSATQSAVAVVPPALPPQTVIVPVPVPAAVVAPRVDNRPPRHRRGVVILLGAFMGIVALGMASIGLTAFTGNPADSSSPTSSLPPIAAVSGSPGGSGSGAGSPSASATATASPTATPAPTPKPTPRPTRRPTPRPTPVPTPVSLFAAWQTGHVPGVNPPLPTSTNAPFYLQTIPTAECRMARLRTNPVSTTTRYSGWSPANASGQLTINWTSYTWTSGSTYNVWAECRTVGTTTPVVTITPPASVTIA